MCPLVFRVLQHMCERTKSEGDTYLEFLVSGSVARKTVVGRWVLYSLLTRWSLSCFSLSGTGCFSSHSQGSKQWGGPVEIASGPTQNSIAKIYIINILYFGPQNQKILPSDLCYGIVLRTIRVQVRQQYKFVDMTVPCIAIVNKILCHRYRSCEFSRVIKQYAIRKNDLSMKEKMLQTNRQTLRKNASKK